jgi:hypothetical protein
MNVTPEQSKYVVENLLNQGKIRTSQVRRVLETREREIRSLRDRLASLEGPGGFSSGRRASRGRPALRRGVARRKMSPRVRALRQMQGQYMGYVRRLNAEDKARVRAVREKQGMEAAIRIASSIATRS